MEVAMANYEFSLKFQLAAADEDPARHLEALLDNGCDDATVSMGRPGRIVLDFDRDAESAGDAIASAIADVERAIGGVVLTEIAPDLVNLSDLADLFGCSRQNMRKYASGEAKSISAAFPAPAVTTEPPLWHLAEAGPWLRQHTQLAAPDEVFEVAKVAFLENRFVQAKRVEQASNASPPMTTALRLLARSLRGKAGSQTGNRAFNPGRLAATVAALAGSGTGKTKLNKLMFYADFIHYARTGTGITGLAYAAIDHGPVPDQYEIVYAALTEIGAIAVRGEIVGQFTSSVISAAPGAPSGILTREEEATLQAVRQHFSKHTAATIVKISHEEDAWLKTVPGGIITFDYAANLKHVPRA
jgi:uncharacterized phage-associated protein